MSVLFVLCIVCFCAWPVSCCMCLVFCVCSVSDSVYVLSNSVYSLGAAAASQQSDLSSSTSICVSLPVSADGSSSLVRNCSVGDDCLCVMLLGARIADTGSMKGPAAPLGCFGLLLVVVLLLEAPNFWPGLVGTS